MFFLHKRGLFGLIMKKMPIKIIHCQYLPIQQKMIENYQLFGFRGITRRGPFWGKHYLAQIAWQDIHQKTDTRASPKSTVLLWRIYPKEMWGLGQSWMNKVVPFNSTYNSQQDKRPTFFTGKTRIEKELSVMNGQLNEYITEPICLHQWMKKVSI